MPIEDAALVSQQSSLASGLMEKLALNEIEGKNKAIHTYDDVVWKIRTGFLTLLFGGWSVLLKAVIDSASIQKYVPLIHGLLAFSFGFAFGAAFIDRSYIRRKFRVIFALNRLMAEVQACGGDWNKMPSGLLAVAGDNTSAPYSCKDYRQAMIGELMVYWVPLLTLILGTTLVI
jgi:hypothetical protein